MSSLFKNWNWGKGIATVIVILCCGILFVVYRATTYKYDMVIDNYYEEELHFNDQATAIENASKLSQPLKISYEGDFILFEFPLECANKDIKGELQLYRPSDANKDIRVPIKFIAGTVMSIPKKQTIAGNYHAIAQWVMDGKTYKIVKDFDIE